MTKLIIALAVGICSVSGAESIHIQNEGHFGFAGTAIGGRDLMRAARKAIEDIQAQAQPQPSPPAPPPVADDCVNVPEKFRGAEHPYAKAPDGCSSWSDNPEQVRDKYGPVNFNGACDAHDRCYYTQGSDWKFCNDQFRKDLIEACNNGLSTKVGGVLGRALGKKARTPPQAHPMYGGCMSLVAAYYGSVQGGVFSGVFIDAQNLQREYNEWYARCHPQQ